MTGNTGATGAEDAEEKTTLFHSKVLTESMVSSVKALAHNLTTDGSGLEKARKIFEKTVGFANILVDKLVGKSNVTMDDWSEQVPFGYSAVRERKGQEDAFKDSKGLLDDAKYVHEALVEKLPRPIDVLDMVSETESTLKASAALIGSKARCLGECAIEKSRMRSKEESNRKKLLNKVRIKCISEEVEVENKFMKKFKQDELAGEASTKGLLEFSNLVVDMSNKVSAKEKRIEQLKLRLKHLNDAVKVMDESGGKNAKVFLENLRSKCLSKAANEANVELSHNREELKEVYNAKKVVFAMHQRYESLTRQYAMEFKRAPAFSDIERCNNTLKMVKE